MTALKLNLVNDIFLKKLSAELLKKNVLQLSKMICNRFCLPLFFKDCINDNYLKNDRGLNEKSF